MKAIDNITIEMKQQLLLHYLLILSILGLTKASYAQYETVLFDYERNYFNQGQALPAESYFILSGQIDQKIELVEALIYRSQKKQGKPLYRSSWKRSFTNKGETFEIPMNYKLRGSNIYDITFKTYRRASDKERQDLMQSVTDALNNYVDGVIAVDKRRLDISQPAGAMMEDLNDIVHYGMTFYRSKINFDFPGFSDIIKHKIKQLNEAKLSNALLFLGSDKQKEKESIKKAYADQLIQELKEALFAELRQMINAELLLLDDSKVVEGYPVERTRNIIAINAGYGGVYFNGGLNDLSYDGGTYLGLSIPLGNSALTSEFWSNTSISVGAFINNLEDENAVELTGPIFRRPYFVGLGYKAFEFIRINAGATLIETKKETFNFDIKEVSVKPFIGVSAEINLWLGLGKRGQ